MIEAKLITKSFEIFLKNMRKDENIPLTGWKKTYRDSLLNSTYVVILHKMFSLMWSKWKTWLESNTVNTLWKLKRRDG